MEGGEGRRGGKRGCRQMGREEVEKVEGEGGWGGVRRGGRECKKRGMKKREEGE